MVFIIGAHEISMKSYDVQTLTGLQVFFQYSFDIFQQHCFFHGGDTGDKTFPKPSTLVKMLAIIYNLAGLPTLTSTCVFYSTLHSVSKTSICVKTCFSVILFLS